VFALAMMACAAVFGASATLLKENSLSAFTYSLHTFLAVTGMFFLTLLFCRKAIYPPSDLVWAMKHKVDLGSDRPVLAAVLIGIMLVFYGYYQGFIAPEEVRKAQQIGAPVKP
jgi:nitrate reductase gamma subunit